MTLTFCIHSLPASAASIAALVLTDIPQMLGVIGQWSASCLSLANKILSATSPQ